MNGEYSEKNHRDCQMEAVAALETGSSSDPMPAQTWATLAVAAAINRLAIAVERANQPTRSQHSDEPPPPRGAAWSGGS